MRGPKRVRRSVTWLGLLDRVVQRAGGDHVIGRADVEERRHLGRMCDERVLVERTALAGVGALRERQRLSALRKSGHQIGDAPSTRHDPDKLSRLRNFREKMSHAKHQRHLRPALQSVFTMSTPHQTFTFGSHTVKGCSEVEYLSSVRVSADVRSPTGSTITSALFLQPLESRWPSMSPAPCCPNVDRAVPRCGRSRSGSAWGCASKRDRNPVSRAPAGRHGAGDGRRRR